MTVGTAPATASFGTIFGGYSGSVVLPAASSGSGAATLIFANTNPTGGAAVSASARLPKAIGGSLNPLVYITITTAATVTFANWPSFTFILPAGISLAAGSSLYLAYNPGDSAGNWSTLAGPASIVNNTVTFVPSGAVTFTAGTTYAFSLFATGQVLVAPTPSPSPSPTKTASPSPSPTATLPQSAFSCPTSGTLQSIARTGASVQAVRRMPSRPYRSGAAAASAVRNGPALRERRYRLTTAAVYPNDPYFQGFAPNVEQLPYAESATVPGQWDMHAIGLEHAYGYSQAGGTYTLNAGALGSPSIKIAIIDTGEDANHPELSGQIVYQHCFITNDAGTQQSTGNFSIDEDGHGTDVSGIAAAASGNGLGFSGAGGKSVLYGYRVFPTPDDTCASDVGADDTCSAATADIASAINDAVAQGVNVISMSIGGGSCANGVDSDPVEGAAVTNALSHHVIVVAASGNGGSAGVTAPGCISGVIAAGATSLDDGSATGTNPYTSTRTGTASPTNIVEYVTSYTQFGSPGANLHSSSAWGIVAPGGDPSGSNDSDNLHWIENIWTTTPFIGFAGDNNFTGNCSNDFPNSGLMTSPDCRTLIAGTSMATPHVAGAAALILAVNTSYQNPALMKQLLCQTADDLGDSHQGCGRLNVYRAMAVAIGDTAPP